MEEISADPVMTKMSAGCLTETARMREEGYSRADICRFDPLPRSLVHGKYDMPSPTTASCKSLRETSLVGRTKVNSRSSYIVGEASVEGPVVFDDIGDNVGTALYPLPIGDYDGSPRRYGLRLVDPHGEPPRQDFTRPHSIDQNIESIASDSSILIDKRNHEMYNPLHDFDNSNQGRVVKYLPTCIGDFSLETAGYVKSSSYFSSNDQIPTADETKITDSCFEDSDYDSQFLKCIPHKGKTSPEEEVCYQKSISPFGFHRCNDTSMVQDNTSSVVSNPPSLMCSLGNDETMTVEMLSAGRPQISVRNGVTPLTPNVKPVIFTPVSVSENPKSHQLAFDSLASSPERGIFLLGSTVLGRHGGHGHVAFSPGTTECDSGESDLSEEVSVDSSGRAFGVLPTVEDGLSSGHVSDDEYQGSAQAQKLNTKDNAYVTKATNQGGHNQLQQQIVSQFTEQALGQINSYGDHPIENGLIDVNVLDPLNRDSASFPFAASYPQPSGPFHINHNTDLYGASSGHAFSHDQDVPFHHMSTASKKGSKLSGELCEPAVSSGSVGVSCTTADSHGRNAWKSSRTIDDSFQCQQVASLPVNCLHDHLDRQTEFAQNSPDSSSTYTNKFGNSVSSDRDVSRPIPGSSLSTANSILDDMNYLSNGSAAPVTHSNYSGSQPRLADVSDSCLIPKSPPFAEKNEVQAAIHDIRLAIRRTSSIAAASVSNTDTASRSGRPVWVPRRSGYQKLSTTCDDPPGLVRNEIDEIDTDQETDRLLGQQRQHTTETPMPEKRCTKKEKSKDMYVHEPAVLIEGVLFRARYLGSTQLMCDGQPTKSTRMTQAEEAVSRVKVPDGETQPSTDVDLFISTEKIMVLNTDLKEIMMDHALRTISYIADIGDLVVLMARRRITKESDNETSETQHLPRMICHVFESEEAQFIAQSIGQAFQVAYLEFLKANGIEDHSFFKEMDYQDVLNSQEIFGEELRMFAKKELQKEVIVPKQKTEILGVVIVESGWGSLVPTVVIANMAPGGAAARCGLLNIGDQIIAINGVSLVGLPLSTCQHYVKNARHLTAVKLTVVPCAPVVVVRIRRPDTKYQLGFSVQNGVICSLLRGGIAERGGVRVGHRIIEINGQSVVAVAHQRIVSLLANSIGEILMKTMPTSLFRLLTGQETPTYI